MPYATWLVENDRFEDAQDGRLYSMSKIRSNACYYFCACSILALSQAGRQSEAANLLRHLAENAVTENRYMYYNCNSYTVHYSHTCKGVHLDDIIEGFPRTVELPFLSYASRLSTLRFLTFHQF